MFQLRKYGLNRLIFRLALGGFCVLQAVFAVVPIQSALAVSAPNILNYQGRVLNSNGIPVPDATADMIFELYTAAVAGTCVWSNSSSTCASATARTVTLTDGLFSESLGDITASYAAISDSTFSDNGTLYLKVTVNGEALSPRKQLAAAPYAMNSDTLDGLDSDADGSTTTALVALTSAGNVIFTGDPSGATVSTGVVYVNPATAAANETLLGVADNGTERFRLDKEGDVTVAGTTTSADFACTDCLDFAEMSDSLTLDASTAIAMTGSQTYTLTNGSTANNIVNLTSTGDFAVQSGGSTYWTFRDDSSVLYAPTLATSPSFVMSLATTSTNGIDVTANSLTSGAMLQLRSSAAFSGSIVDFDVLGAATGTYIDITSSSATATGKVLGITLQNGNNNNDVMTLVTDETTTSGTAAGDVKARLTASGEFFSDVGFTAGGASTRYRDGSISTTSVTTFDFQDAAGASTTLDLGGVTTNLANTINIATNSTSADSISIGNANASTILALTGGDDWSVTAGGIGTFTDLSCVDCLNFDSLDDTLSLDAFTYISGGAGEELVVDRQLTDATAEVGFTVQVEGSDTTSSTLFQHAMRITNRPAAEAVDSLLAMDNNDADDMVSRGLWITDIGGGINTAIDVSDSDIVTALSVGLNDISGTNFSITGAGLGTFTDVACTDCLDFTELSDTLALDTSTNIALNAAETLSMTNTGTGSALLITQDVVADATTTPTTQALVINVNESQNNDEVILIVSDADGTPDAEFRFENDGDLFGDGATYNSGADYAEFFYTLDSSLADHQVVCQDPVNNLAVKKCGLGDRRVIGVVSTKPGFVGNNIPGADGSLEGNPNYRIVGLEGQIETYVTAADGAIAVGDALTASAITAGYAGKANSAGRVVGFAMEPMAAGSGLITVRVSPGWDAGEILADDGDLTSVGSLLALESLATATAAAPASDSHGLAFRGSAWDGSAAQTVAMTLSNKVASSSSYRLSVANNSGAEVAYINNLGDLVLSGKLYPSNQGTAQTSAYVYYDSQGVGYMRTNAAGWGTGSYDFAEMFPSPESLSPGDVVVFGDGAEQVKRSTGEKYDDRIAGVVSTRPGFLAGTYKPGDQPIALSGRVPTRVNIENGAIAIGDPLTTSSVPGVAMKATEAGPIVGYAMQPFTEGTGMITVFIRASYYDGGDKPALVAAPVSAVTSSGDLSSLSLNGGAITSVGSIAGIGNVWSLGENGDLITHGRLVQVVKSYQNENVDTFPVVAREQTLQLSGTVTLNNNTAEVKFEDIDPKFNDIMSVDSTYRVLATPAGLTGQIYVTDRTTLGFTVHAESAADGTLVDWLVIAPHKDYVPVTPVVAGASEEVEEVSDPAPEVDGVEEVVEAVVEDLTVGAGLGPAPEDNPMPTPEPEVIP